MVEQSKPGGRRLRSIDLVAVFCFCCACAELAAVGENPSSAKETPVPTTKTPIKMRRLKKSDCEVDLFFMRCHGGGGFGALATFVRARFPKASVLLETEQTCQDFYCLRLRPGDLISDATD